jgi:hypothetical protein
MMPSSLFPEYASDPTNVLTVTENTPRRTAAQGSQRRHEAVRKDDRYRNELGARQAAEKVIFRLKRFAR